MPLYMTSTPDNRQRKIWHGRLRLPPNQRLNQDGKKVCMCITHSMRALCCVPFCMRAAQEQSTNLVYSCPPPQSEHKKMPQKHKKTTFNPTSGETLNELISKVKGVTKWHHFSLVKKYSHVIHHPDTSRTLDPEESLFSIAARILQVLAVILTPEKDLSLPQKNIVRRIMAHKDMISIEESTSRFEGSITPGAFNLFVSGLVS